MEFFRKKSKLRDVLFLLTGTALMAIAINMVYEPMNMITGGVTGIGIMVKKLTETAAYTGVPVWLTNLVLNIPLFIAAFLMAGKRFLGRTLFATVALSGFLYLIPIQGIFEQDYLLAAVFGGAISGVGIGLVFAASASTGGTDLLSSLLHLKMRQYTVPQLLICIDGIVVLAGAAVFGINESLYAVIAIVIIAKMSDGILEGLKFSKMAYIISGQAEAIAKEILVRLDRGVTGINATGKFTKSEKEMLMCVVSKKEMVEVMDIVYQFDRTAFVIVSDVREVMGEGFIDFGKN